MEIGPGDELSSSIFFENENFTRQLFIDKKKYASPLLNMNYEYLTKGIDSFRFIEEKTVSFIFANSVFQHISLDEVHKYFDEINRVLVKGGVISLILDFKDMINGGLFMHVVPDSIWHSKLIKNKLFYTNKLLPDEYEKIFESMKFRIVEKNLSYFKNLDHIRFVENISNKKEPSFIVSGCHYVLKSED
jgi:ubiquinone/menaquinone biosynthesis C-methylase UbiE